MMPEINIIFVAKSKDGKKNKAYKCAMETYKVQASEMTMAL